MNYPIIKNIKDLEKNIGEVDDKYEELKKRKAERKAKQKPMRDYSTYRKTSPHFQIKKRTAAHGEDIR